MIIITLLNASLLLFSADSTWYCKKSSKYYVINKGSQCSEMTSGKAYYKRPQDSNPQSVKDGKFFIEGGKIKVSYTGSNAKTEVISLGPVQFKPEVEQTTSDSTQSDSRSSQSRQSGGRDGNSHIRGDRETTNQGWRPKNKNRDRDNTSGLLNKFPPRVADFSRNRKQAREWANADWNKMDLAARGQHIFEVAEALIAGHGYTHYTPQMVVCKSYKESTFDPQIQASTSTASGLSQVTQTSVKDMTKRYGWPRSIVPGFENIRDGLQFKTKMALNMAAQLEAGLFILEMKRRDIGSKNIHTLLKNYYGTKSAYKNTSYANSIMACANCIGNNNVTKRCLDKAKR